MSLKKFSAFAVTVEFVLITLLCAVIVGVCLAKLTDNMGNLFTLDRNYKKLFERRMD